MKALVILSLALVLSACNDGNGGSGGSDAATPKIPSLTPVPNYGIKDIYEYVNADGLCQPSEKFGDGSNGCIHYAQITRFVDGSAFLSVEVGDGYLWSLTEFFPVGSTTYSKSLLYSISGGVTPVEFRFTGDLSSTVPTFSANYDTNGVMSDGTAKAFTLSAVQ